MGKVGLGGHDYYLTPSVGPDGVGVEPQGRWTGAGAAELGLGGALRADEFVAVLSGVDPADGRLLGGRRDKVRVAAYDLTFCAPKSVSLLGALGDEEVGRAVEQAHRHAVDAGVGYLEERALAVRRRSEGLRLPVAAEAVASASFLHRTSRSLDPHLHEHVVMANLGRAPDGTWSALDGRGIYAHAGAAAAVYHAQLRAGLTAELGVAWTGHRHGRAEVAGIDACVRRAFSSRTRAIAAHLADRDLTSLRAQTVASHVTRPDKQLVAADALRPWWRARARDEGFGPRRVEAVLDRAPRHPEPGHVDGALVSAELAERGLGSAGVARRDVVRAVASTQRSGAARHVVDAHVGQFLDERGIADDRSRRGVAEPRTPLADHALVRELDELLARRGMTRARGHDRADERGPGLGL